MLLRPAVAARKGLVIVRMNDRLHGVDFRVYEERGKGRADHRLAGDLPILLGHFAASAKPAPGRDDNSRYPRRHEN